MQKYIAVAAGLAIFTFVFYKDLLNFPTLNLRQEVSLPQTVEDEAWRVFEDYREAAKAHDLEKIKTLSHQVSPACSDPARIDECKNLMDTAYLATRDFWKSDFKHIFHDERQIVMMTDQFSGENNTKAQVIVFFTRTSAGEPKMLSMKLCFKVSAATTGGCFDPSPLTRDKDRNGWWDEVEARFYK